MKVVGGVITAVNPGTCRVLAISPPGVRRAIKVTVKQFAAISEYALEPLTLEIAVGEIAELKAKVLPENADQTLKWSSKAPKIASVKNGMVTAKKVGKTKIICKFANGKTLVCVVTVTK